MLIDGERAVQACVGRIISNIRVYSCEVRVFFEGGVYLVIEDEQSCCEARYFHSDDLNLDYYKGATFMGIRDLRDFSCESDGGDREREQCFLDIVTSKGVVSISCHVEHNGYYGGFHITTTLRS